ncbi:hypothetical protein FOA52_007009 [Chlamydomonas sp. UWO 241]|nr:hypothetical protein FOA52_007009 [Chlamydomonas sp. UWO 241]
MLVLPSYRPMTPAGSLSSSLSDDTSMGAMLDEESRTQSDALQYVSEDDALLRPPFRASVPTAARNMSDDYTVDLPDDLLMEVLSKLDGNNRHAVHGCSRRLHSLAHGTFKSLAVPVPAPGSGALALTAEQASTLAAMTTVVLQLPPLEESGKQAVVAKPAAGGGHVTAAGPEAALDAFLAAILPAAGASSGMRAEVMRIRALDSSVCRVSYSALARLAGAARSLCRLSLPAVSCASAAAFSLMPRTLTALSVTVCDGTVLDAVLGLTQLRHLSVSTRRGLLYLLLSPLQVADLARMRGLQSLSLNRVLLNDCRMSWTPLSELTSLTELQVSSPFSAERLQQLPASLRVLQAPFFTGGLDAASLQHLPRSFALSELRTRQALTEVELSALAAMVPTLATLQCDNIALSDAAVGAALAEVERAREGDAAALRPALPALRSVATLRLTGVHTYNGLLGAVFPELATLQVASVVVPRPPPSYTAPLLSLTRLAWPSSKVLPDILAASPRVSCLVVTNINCLQRLDELLHMPPPPPGLADACGMHDDPLPAVAGPTTASRGGSSGTAAAAAAAWWPPLLSDVTLGFSSSLRFRPKQVAVAMAAAPAAARATVTRLELRDHAHDAVSSSAGGGGAGACAGRVVDDSVLAASLAAMSSVRNLKLSDCGALTAPGLLAALERAPARLASVTVAGCAKVPRARCERIPHALGRVGLNVVWREAGGA